jgi:hypothetical protein
LNTQYLVQKDTDAWRVQVWSSFAIALLACGIGVVQMPGEQLDRAFLAIGFFFCLFSSFSVAKTVRDNRDGQVDTAGWRLIVWIAFFAAVLLTGWGLYRMEVAYWQKGYMVVGWLFLVSSTFTLAKTVRDQHDATLIESGSGLPRAG